MNRGRVVVVGAGMGGLACALKLAHAGREVVVVDAAATPGGKMRQVQIGGHALDAGPTVFTMRWVFEELLAECGHDLAAQLPMGAATTLGRHAWADRQHGTVGLDLFASTAASADAIGAFAGPSEARSYLAFAKRSRQVYQALERAYVRGSRPSPWSLVRRVGWRGLPGLSRISPFTTLWQELGTHFKTPRMRQLFGRYATYCGSSPFLAPATLMLIAHVEQDGLWLVDGGMHRVATMLADLTVRAGGRIRYSTQVREVLQRNGQVTGVRLENAEGQAETLSASVVVYNGDVAALAAGLLGPDVAAASPKPAPRSLSALTWNMVTVPRGYPLLRHTVFFSDNCEAEFNQIFRHHQLPDQPTVYVCALDRGDHSPQPACDGPERLLCLVNAPANGDTAPWHPASYRACESEAWGLLQRCGLSLSHLPSASVVTTPRDFGQMFPGTGGALYGQPSHGWMASFKRPGARTAIRGLYLAGGSVHPGPGVPMAALSGRQAAASVLEDRW